MDDHLNMDDDLPPFDVHSKCIKCGYQIEEPEPLPEPKAPAGPPAAKPADKPKPKESSAFQPKAMPVKAPPPTVEYCSGIDCPWGEEAEELGEHMHQFCDTCGFEWLSRPLDWKAP